MLACTAKFQIFKLLAGRTFKPYYIISKTFLSLNINQNKNVLKNKIRMLYFFTPKNNVADKRTIIIFGSIRIHCQNGKHFPGN